MRGSIHRIVTFPHSCSFYITALGMALEVPFFFLQDHHRDEVVLAEHCSTYHKPAYVALGGSEDCVCRETAGRASTYFQLFFVALVGNAVGDVGLYIMGH
jgi:hypothetical protein